MSKGNEMPTAVCLYTERRRAIGLGASGLLVLAAISLLSACDADESERRGAQFDSSGSKRVSATAEDVAEAARGKLKCPAKVTLAERDLQAPIDDVVGVRPGMSYEEAANVVMCTHDLMVVQPEASRGFRIETYGHTLRQGFSARLAEPKVRKTSREIMQEMQDRSMARSTNRVVRDMQPGQVKWYVGTMGLPGQERVINAAREEWFEEERNPTIASIERALIEKYGAPTRIQRDVRSTRLTWAYDPLGRAIGETSPLFHQCRGMPDPDGGSSFSPNCGLVVAATLTGMKTNLALAQLMQVGVVDQAGGYEALTATERALQQLDRKRKARETEAASKNAIAPTL